MQQDGARVDLSAFRIVLQSLAIRELAESRLAVGETHIHSDEIRSLP